MDRYSTISAQMLYELGVQSSLTKAVRQGRLVLCADLHIARRFLGWA